MQRYIRNSDGEADAPASETSQVNSEAPHVNSGAADGNVLTHLLEEVASRVSFSEDAALYVAGASGKILFLSAGYHNLVGGLPENGRVEEDVYQFICNNGESYVHDVTVQKDVDSAPRYIRSYHYPLNDERGNLLGIAGHYVDMSGQATALARAGDEAARKHDQLRSGSDLFWELDADGQLAALSDKASGILGKPAALFLGRELGAIGRFVDRAGADAQPPPGFLKHQPFRDAIFQMQGHDGQRYHFHMSGVPIFDSGSGKFQGFRGAAVDVTERFKAEDRAAEALRELEMAREALMHRNIQLDIERARTEKALRAKTEFLATMSHELRTPLNAILGFSEAMSMKLFGELSDQYAGYSNDILKSGKHLLSLINAMLESARVEGSEISPNPQQVDISGLIQQAVNIVRMRAAGKNLDISNAAVEPGWVVKADPMLTTQILVNLLSNAVKFTNAGGVIGVDVKTDIKDGAPALEITVWDTGIGIAPDMQKKVFEKFVRGDNAVDYDDTGQGIGLGLHISRRLAELMQGTLRLQSFKDKGSRFTLSLPLVSAP